MVIDSSAILSIVLDEPEASLFAEIMSRAARPRLSAAGIVELASVGTRKFAGRYDARIDLLLGRVAPEIIPVTSNQAVVARAAYRRFGLGTGHKARLNFGDCFSYALARELDEPLLFKGDDFIHTDVKQAIPR